MKETRTEIVSVRLTKAERAWLDKMGGPQALRQALYPAPQARFSQGIPTGTIGQLSMVWFDGTVGGTWPAVLTSP